MGLERSCSNIRCSSVSPSSVVSSIASVVEIVVVGEWARSILGCSCGGSDEFALLFFFEEVFDSFHRRGSKKIFVLVFVKAVDAGSLEVVWESGVLPPESASFPGDGGGDVLVPSEAVHKGLMVEFECFKKILCADLVVFIFKLSCEIDQAGDAWDDWLLGFLNKAFNAFELFVLS